MPEDGSGCPVRRLPWPCGTKAVFSLFFVMMLCLVGYLVLPARQQQQQQQLEPPGWDIAELQLNHTGPRQDPRLYWQGGPALGRTFLHGAELDDGQLRVHRKGIYRLHIQVTLANCPSRHTTVPRNATLTVGICASATYSLMRLPFNQDCTVSSQRLTPLALGDTLCTNLSLPLLPSQNADETFFGIQWVHPGA
ncbi:CD70 antigen [Lemur catta]|uniref:CD70 antigen n=1 Tax=Lemur catta TaxID=9447 RepID=UPI001E26B5B0|nr:CD70 antigen [Lemur catta]XP_045404594.1 CD70 antigen [Lemur catta]XP_045404603.1 CD70 antigen [Lemur catta]